MAVPSTNLVQVLQRYVAPPAQPIGAVYPPHADAPNLPDMGAREHSLRRFCDFLAELPFMRSMAGPPQPFVVPRDHIHINQPANVAGAPDGVQLPTIAFLTSENNNATEAGFLGPAIIDDDSADVYGPDTAVFWLGDHVEELTLEVVSSGRAVRRAIVEGIKQVLRSTDSGPLKLSLPAYYDQVATFTLLTDTFVEDPDAVRNRRRAWIRIQLYVPEVMLGNALDLHVSATTQVTVTTSADVSADACPST